MFKDAMVFGGPIGLAWNRSTDITDNLHPSWRAAEFPNIQRGFHISQGPASNQRMGRRVFLRGCTVEGQIQHLGVGYSGVLRVVLLKCRAQDICCERELIEARVPGGEDNPEVPNVVEEQYEGVARPARGVTQQVYLPALQAPIGLNEQEIERGLRSLRNAVIMYARSQSLNPAYMARSMIGQANVTLWAYEPTYNNGVAGDISIPSFQRYTENSGHVVHYDYCRSVVGDELRSAVLREGFSVQLSCYSKGNPQPMDRAFPDADVEDQPGAYATGMINFCGNLGHMLPWAYGRLPQEMGIEEAYGPGYIAANVNGAPTGTSIPALLGTAQGMDVATQYTWGRYPINDGGVIGTYPPQIPRSYSCLAVGGGQQGSRAFMINSRWDSAQATSAGEGPQVISPMTETGQRWFLNQIMKDRYQSFRRKRAPKPLKHPARPVHCKMLRKVDIGAKRAVPVYQPPTATIQDVPIRASNREYSRYLPINKMVTFSSEEGFSARTQYIVMAYSPAQQTMFSLNVKWHFQDSE